MELYIIITIVVACVLAAIGLIVGFCLGYIRLSCWGGTVVGTALTCLLVDRTNVVPEGDWHGIIMLAVAAGTMLVLTLLCNLVRRYLARQVNKSKQLSFYRQHDGIEDNEESILIALDKGDKKAYRRHSSRRFSQKRGAWGVVDRVFGALTLTINIFTAVALVASLALIIIDSAEITVARDALLDFYQSAFWQGEGSALAIDMLVISLMCVCVRSGYNGGILSALSAIIIIALIGGAGYLAYYLVFDVQAFASATQGVYDSLLAAPLANVQESLSGAGLTPEVLGGIIVTAGLFVIFLIPAIIISIFIPRAFDKLRNFATVEVVDGALGAIILTAVIFGILLFLGALVWQIHDLEGFEIFNSYMANSYVANGLYGDNGITTLTFMQNLPLRQWVGLE